MNVTGQSFLRKALRLFTAGVPMQLASDEIFAIRPGASIPAMLAYGPIGSGEEPRKPYRMLDGGIAEIAVTGVLSRSPSLYRMFGCSNQPTLGEIAEAFHQAREDSAVTGVLAFFSTPGGTVHGTPDAAAAVAQCAAAKPVHGYIQDECHSAGYWLGCQAARLTAGRGAELGSIGVYSVLLDASKAAGMEGLKFYVISSGKYKGAGANPGAGLSEEHLAYFQERVNDSSALFVADFAAGRGLALEAAEELADGRAYIASRALGLGLCDAVGTYEEALAALRAEVESPTQPRPVPPASEEPAPEEEMLPEPGEEEAMSDNKQVAAQPAAVAGEDIGLREKFLALLGIKPEVAAPTPPPQAAAPASPSLTAEDIDSRVQVAIDQRMRAAEVAADLKALEGRVPPAVLNDAETKALLLDAKAASPERYKAALGLLAGNDGSALLGGPIASAEVTGEARAGLMCNTKEVALLGKMGITPEEIARVEAKSLRVN